MWSYIKKAINSDFLTEALDVKIDRVEVDTQDIQSKVSTVDTVVDRIEADTTELLADTGRIEADTQDIQSSVGSNSDTSSSTGSIHAKLKDLRDSNLNIATLTQSSTGMNTYYTVVNVSSGKGTLKNINVYDPTGLDNLKVKITIDGTVTNIDTTYLYLFLSVSDNNQDYTGNIPINVRYDSSLKVEIATTQGSNTIKGAVLYSTR